MKRFLSVLLAVVLCLGMFPITAAAADPFDDVSSDQWYYADVIKAYEMGLINGKSTTLFKPNDNLTYAEAVKLAACMYQVREDPGAQLTNGTPWYQTYVDYCKEEGIISKEYPWNEAATRAGYMEIFAKALSEGYLNEINTVPDGAVPDVPMEHPQAEAIYRLYRAGIVQGVDAERSCRPDETIKRSEVAAILTRMMDRTARVNFCLDPDLLYIARQPVDAAAAETVTFRVEVTGGKPPYRYQWQLKASADGKFAQWSDFDREGTNAAYQKPELVLQPSASFLETVFRKQIIFRCVITDSAGQAVTSNEVRIIPN